MSQYPLQSECACSCHKREMWDVLCKLNLSAVAGARRSFPFLLNSLGCDLLAARAYPSWFSGVSCLFAPMMPGPCLTLWEAGLLSWAGAMLVLCKNYSLSTGAALKNPPEHWWRVGAGMCVWKLEGFYRDFKELKCSFFKIKLTGYNRTDRLCCSLKKKIKLPWLSTLLSTF